jgi:hypothetical protein
MRRLYNKRYSALCAGSRRMAMRVKYTPPLMEQIKALTHKQQDVIGKPFIVHNAAGLIIQEVDPVSRQATGRPQQFTRQSDGISLNITPSYEWVENPDVVIVNDFKF